MNGAPGTPSDDEDLPHPLPGVVSAGLSATGPQGPHGLWEGGAAALPEKELPAVRPARFVEAAVCERSILQRSLSEGLDAIEAPKGPGERPLGAASPRLCSSFPTHTRLSDILHIDSDEDEERSAINELLPLPPSPLLLNGEPADGGGPDDDDLFLVEPELRLQGAEGGPGDALVAEPGLELDNSLEPEVFLEVDEEQTVTHDALPEAVAALEQEGAPGDDPTSEMDSFSMATAPQTAGSSSDSGAVTMATAVVSLVLQQELDLMNQFLSKNHSNVAATS